MNIYGIIILLALLLEFILNIISDILNIKNLKPELPAEFKDVYDENEYRRSQEYTREKTRFGLITSAFALILLLVFWFFSGFEFIDTLARQWADSVIFRGLIFVGILVLLQTMIMLPFRMYNIFIIEEKYEFNKMTSGLFWADLFKSLGLGILIGAPVLGLIIFIFDTQGDIAWLWGWGAVTFFTLLLQYIAPTYIMPIFNKFQPLEEGELRTRIFEYAGKVNFSLENIYVMDGSKRSTKSNAFFTGFGKNKRIALFDTLIEKHSTDELVAVLAHEIGHYKKKHILKGMLLSIIHTGVLFYLLNLFINTPGLYEAFYMDSTPVYAGLIFFSLLYSPVELILSVILNIFSRKNEYEADNFAVKTTGLNEAMVNALKKLSRHNLSNLTPHPFYVFINYSHPPLTERINAIKNY